MGRKRKDAQNNEQHGPIGVEQSLTDSLSYGEYVKKNRLQAIRLAAEHTKIERQNNARIEYRKIGPKTWVQKKTGTNDETY